MKVTINVSMFSQHVPEMYTPFSSPHCSGSSDTRISLYDSYLRGFLLGAITSFKVPDTLSRSLSLPGDGHIGTERGESDNQNGVDAAFTCTLKWLLQVTWL